MMALSAPLRVVASDLGTLTVLYVAMWILIASLAKGNATPVSDASMLGELVADSAFLSVAGTLLRWLLSRFGGVRGILGSALLFALLHARLDVILYVSGQ
jgi:hypothetical protein